MKPNHPPRARVVVFPFDTFGNSGTGDGARLLGDVLQEAIDDTAEESRLTRSHSFTDSLEIVEHPLDDMDAIRNWRTLGKQAAQEALYTNPFTVWLSGNHLGVLPVYEALTPRDLVIQFDAHLDCYDLHDTIVTLSPGNFLLEVESLPTIVNVGNRDLFLLSDDARKTFAASIPIDDIASDLGAVAALLRKRVQKAKRVWIDLDVDVFDPVFAPAVHHPLPVGLTPQQFLTLLHAVWSNKVVGLSVSEFDPGRDDRDRTLNLLGWLLERILLKRFEPPR